MWFASSKAEPNTSTTRQDRQKCWEHRDSYYSCLDKASIVKPGDEGGRDCLEQKAAYHEHCAKSWIEYFNQRRVLAERQKHMLAQINSSAGNAKSA